MHQGGETQQGKHMFGPLEVDLRSLKGLSIALEGQDFVDVDPPGHLMCVCGTPFNMLCSLVMWSVA